MTRPERPSTIELDDKPREACGVVGFVPRSEDPVALTADALSSIHNRGEDGTGIAIFGPDLTIIKNLGRSDRAFKGGTLLETLGKTAVALGHVQYNTDEANPEESLQPTQGIDFAVAHNGQFTNVRALAKKIGVGFNGESDSMVFTNLLSKVRGELGSTELALEEILPKLAGAFSLAIMEKDRIIAARDRRGWRPLSIGRLADGGYGVCSESAVFSLLDGELIDAVNPGTYVVLDKDKFEPHRWAKSEPATCGLEYAYFSRTDSEIDGIGVAKARYEMGKSLAIEFPHEIDVVMPMPDSGRHAATGFAHKIGKELVEGFYRNDEYGRIYIKSKSRSRSAKLKNHAIEEVVKGKRIVVVDDSMIRGDTARQATIDLRKKDDQGVSRGAKEVHWISAFPKVKSNCYYGMNMRQRDGFVAEGKNDQEIARAIGADSITYSSLEQYKEAVGRKSLCDACVSGNYPEPIEPEMIESEHIPA